MLLCLQVGGGAGGCHPPSDGLGWRRRAAGVGGRRAGGCAVQLADAALHGAGLDVQGACACAQVWVHERDCVCVYLCVHLCMFSLSVSMCESARAVHACACMFACAPSRDPVLGRMH